MDKSAAVPIKSLKGWKLTDDSEHVLLGFEQPSGKEFAIAIDRETVVETLIGLVDAVGSLAKKGVVGQETLTIQTNWFDIFQTDNPDQLILAFRTPGGGSLLFSMDRIMAARLAENVDGILSPSSSEPPSGASKH
jgi:hypothetical protein